MNIVFAGTPAFAVPSLEALLATERVRAVLTQPDRPAGRGRQPAESPVKQLARARGLPILQPSTLKGFAAELAPYEPDVMVVVAYGLILPREILALPRFGCLNVHASLLPRWRGAAPIPRAIEAGDSETGVTIMQMDEGLDTGPILLAARTPIEPTDTAASLHDRLSVLGAQVLIEALARLKRGELAAVPQDETRACYARKLDKREALLDWRLPAEVLHRKIRAFNPTPVAYTFWRGRRLRLWEVGPLDPSADRPEAPPGTVVAADPERGIEVATGSGLLALTRLQLEGGRILSAGEFLNGYRLAPGERFAAEAEAAAAGGGRTPPIG
jgi:methionyl-tRNA formyltransferase